MLKKNIDTYKARYKDIDKDAITRIQRYMIGAKFSDKDMKRFRKEVDRISSLEHETIKMVLYIIPESTPRPRLNMAGHNFYVKNAASNNKFMQILVEHEDMLKGYIVTPCEFTCRMYFPIPGDMNKVETLLAEMGYIQPPIQKDWDNLGKTYSDMVQKWLLINDALIVRGVSEKYWSLKPRVEIEITYTKEPDCKYNARKIMATKAYQDTIKDGDNS